MTDALPPSPSPTRSALPPDDQQRALLHNEVHARPTARIRLPALVVYVAVLNEGISREQELAHLRLLPGQQDLPPEVLHDHFVRLRLGNCTLKWERHSEYTRYSIVQSLPEGAGLEAESPPLDALAIDPAWLAAIPGRTITAIKLAMVIGDIANAPEAAKRGQRWLGGRSVVASIMGTYGHSIAVTSFRLREDGFEHMLAMRLPGLLPPLSAEAALESAAVLSLAGVFVTERFGERPFRSPHHTSSTAALVGGGSVPRPGEISLAHRGVLFLDELPEFERRVLEALREPLETGRIHIARAAHQAEFPARFQLVAAMNPCPCGYHGARSGRCRCTPDQVARYRGKLSGPLLDRIDLQLEVPALAAEELQATPRSEPSAAVRARVVAARGRQQARQGKPNARLTPREVETHCTPDADGAALLRQAMARLGLSARAYHRLLRVARSIADLAGSPAVTSEHVAEAVQYRRFAQD